MTGPSVVCRRTPNGWQIAIAMAGSDVFVNEFVAWKFSDSEPNWAEEVPLFPDHWDD